MTATDLFSAGRLRAAIVAQSGKVRAHPADRKARLFLFELCAFAGDLDGARRHLDLVRYDGDDHRHAAGVDRLRGALDAEARRREVFAGAEPPAVLGAPVGHVGPRVEALGHLARGEHADARRRLDEANAAVPAEAGALNGRPFAGLYDADERFGTVLEVFGPGGRYLWVPLERVAGVILDPPRAPRDILWRPARLALSDGDEGDVLLPGLYPGTDAHPDEEVRLGRATEWVGADGEVARGAGGRVLLTDDGVVRFHDVTTLVRTAS